MRIALVSREFPPTRQASGIATYTDKTSRALAAAGHDVDVFAEAHRAAPDDEIRHGVRVHRMPDPRLKPREARFLRRTFDVARALRTHGPFDVVQACEWEGEAALYARFAQAPLITRLATPLYVVERLNRTSAGERRRSAVVRALERSQTRLSAAVMSPSRSLAEIVSGDWKLDPERIRIVPTGIELPLSGADGPLPDGLGTDPYVLYFGRLEVRKGVLAWMDALPRVFSNQPGLDAVFAGDDLKLDGVPFSDYGRRRCGVHAGRLRFFKRLPQSQLFPLIRQARLVVLPSRWESLANAGLEAMALGRAVVATRGSGFAEIIEHGVNGWLVPPDDAEALADTVIEALRDRDRLLAVGSAASRRAQDFRMDLMLERLTDLYHDVLATQGRQISEASAV
jgi:glycosyltransferase involved in cell wall biosynthesis